MRNLAAAAAIDAPLAAWVPTMPERVHSVAQRWSLTLGPAYEPGGDTAWVAPVTTADGAPRVLKVGLRHREAEHEAAALRLWDGRGAVVLHRYECDDDTMYFLLEQCVPGSPLRTRPLDEQDDVIAATLRRTWATSPDATAFRPLRDLCAIWADETEQRAADDPDAVDAVLVRDAVEMMRILPGDRTDQRLLCTDLHAGNVLAATREPWLLIDPKPYVGDPAYDVVQHLLNDRPLLVADPMGRTAALAALLDLEVARVRAWMFARSVTELFWWPDLLPAARALARGL